MYLAAPNKGLVIQSYFTVLIEALALLSEVSPGTRNNGTSLMMAKCVNVIWTMMR